MIKRKKRKRKKMKMGDLYFNKSSNLALLLKIDNKIGEDESANLALWYKDESANLALFA